jgi:hypothetical protein
LPEIRALSVRDLLFYLRAIRRRSEEVDAATVDAGNGSTHSGANDVAPDRLTLAAEAHVFGRGRN